jgi:hypothetical protein
VIQQLGEAFPSDRTPRYLLLDRDSICSAEATAASRSFGIDPVRTAYHSPWQNPLVKRGVETCRRELLGYVIVFDEGHLQRLLADDVAHDNAERAHTRVADSPERRPIESRPSPAARVVGLPRVGGLHRWHVWVKAA